MAKYYYYIAGMADLNASNPKAAPEMETLREELRETLTKRDFRLVEMLDEKLIASEDGTLDREKAEEYYRVRLTCHNKFMRRWTEFNLNINNIMTALICRQNGWNIADNIVGKNAVTDAIMANQNVKDFGLRDEVDNMGALMQILDTENLMEREQRIDALKWQWLEENTMFEFFTVEQVLVQFLKAQMLNRWNILTAEEGERVFRQIIENLKKDVKF